MYGDLQVSFCSLQESGSTADLRILLMADLRHRPVGSRESEVHSVKGKIAGTSGKPQNLLKGETGPAGAKGNS